MKTDITPGRVWMVEGVDGVGKSTFITALAERIKTWRMEYPYYIHCTGPLKGVSRPERWQKRQFIALCDVVLPALSESGRDVILDRSWIGEYVYGRMYREGDPREWLEVVDAGFRSKVPDHVWIQLINEGDWNLRKDGAHPHEDNLEEEQEAFIDTWNRSILDRVIVSTRTRDNVFIPAEILVDEVIDQCGKYRAWKGRKI